MKDYAVVFPGQGSQAVGMLSEFMSNAIVAKTFAEANEALGYDLQSICLNGPAETLNKTEVTQPAILTASVAAYRALMEKVEAPKALAGHSLGEYSALVAAGALDFADAVRLVRVRGQAMQEAVPVGMGSMAAVLGLEDEVVIEGCKEASQGEDAVWAANFNSPGQIVISGTKSAVGRAIEILSGKGAKKVVELAVSAPSHCPLMQKAADRLRDELAKISVNDAKIDVYCNAFAKAITKKDEIIEALILQLTGPVHYVQSINNIKNANIITFVEAGPGKVLTGLNRRIDKSLTLCNVNDEATLAKTVDVLMG